MVKIAFLDKGTVVVTSQSCWSMTPFHSQDDMIVAMEDHPFRESNRIYLRGVSSSTDFNPIKAGTSVIGAIGEYLEIPNSKVIMSSWDFIGNKEHHNVCKK